MVEKSKYRDRSRTQKQVDRVKKSGEGNCYVSNLRERKNTNATPQNGKIKKPSQKTSYHVEAG